jgi:hypothetical protein
VTIQCEACGNSNVRISHQSQPMDAVQARNGQRPYRCRDCRTRFYSQALVEPPAKKHHRTHRRSVRKMLRRRKGVLINASIFLVVLGLFFLCLHYLVNYHPESESSQTPSVGCGTQNVSAKLPRPNGNRQQAIAQGYSQPTC